MANCRVALGLWLCVAVAGLGTSLSACGGGSELNCAADADGDGLDDCQEQERGTDRLDPDSDRDGLSDGAEVTHHGTDPTRPTLLVEVDSMAGTGIRPSDAVLSIARDSFAHAGIEVVFEVEPQDIAAVTPLVDDADMEAVLRTSRDLGRPEHLHVVFGVRGDGDLHGTAHFAAPNTGNFSNAPEPQNAGAFVFVDAIRNHHQQNPLLGERDIGVDLVIARALVHEIGHLIGCSHESAIDGEDLTNVMAQPSLVGAVSDQTIDRWLDATKGAGRVGYPTFSDVAIAQMDTTHKASVEIGTSPYARSFDFGTELSPVAAGSFRVTIDHDFSVARGWGWDAPGPFLGFETGSSPGDDRLLDYVSGDPNEPGDVVFRVSALGRGPARVLIRLGATTSDTLRVRCEIEHPERGVVFVEGTIDAANPSVQTGLTGVLSYPVLAPNALGNGRGELAIRCIDDDTHEDAPIEYITVTKQDP